MKSEKMLAILYFFKPSIIFQIKYLTFDRRKFCDKHKATFTLQKVYNQNIDNSLKWILILLALGLSGYQFLFNRNLWIDEVTLALNIVNRSCIELFQSLNYSQSAPILFLLIEKFFCTIIDNSEYGLRIFPLLCYWLSIFLFYRVTNLLNVEKYVLNTSLAFFCLTPMLLYYSSEAKQYMTDVFTGLSIYYLYFKVYKNETNKFILLSFVGCICIFLSNIAVIILFSIALYQLLSYIKERKYPDQSFMFTTIFWGIAFAINYYFFIYNNTLKDYMIRFWYSGFMPRNPFNVYFWEWSFEKINIIAEVMFSFKGIYSFFLYFFYLIGIVTLFYNKKYRILYFLTLPIIIHLFLSAFTFYPFNGERFILYQSPLFIITIATGIIAILQKVTKEKEFLINGAISIISLFLVLKMVDDFPFKQEERNKTIQYVNENILPGDKVFVCNYSAISLKYYEKIGVVKFNNEIIQSTALDPDCNKFKNDIDKYKKELNELNGRNWIFFSSVYFPYVNEILNQISNKGIQIKSYGDPGMCVFLFEFDN